MTPALQSPLRRVVIATFEDLALLLPATESGVPTPRPAFAHAARVAFTGPRSGYLDVRASEGVAAAAAKNMLADGAPTVALCLDALAELANVICGNVVPLLANADDIYRLEAPTDAPLAPPSRADARVDLDVEGGRIEVRLVLTPGHGA